MRAQLDGVGYAIMVATMGHAVRAKIEEHVGEHAGEHASNV